MIAVLTGCWDDQLLCDGFLDFFCNIGDDAACMIWERQGDAQLARRHHYIEVFFGALIGIWSFEICFSWLFRENMREKKRNGMRLRLLVMEC